MEALPPQLTQMFGADVDADVLATSQDSEGA
jgi:hypothetical protein